MPRDDHFDDVPFVGAPFGQDVELLVGFGADAGFVNPDSEDELEALLGGGFADVLGAVAVGGVQADGGEAFGFDAGDVGGDGVGGFALAVACVGGVAEGPLVAVGRDGAVGAG